jgi:hypothetical protein
MAESISHFAIKTVGMSTCNGRKQCTLLEAARHNLREIQAELGASGHINPRRMANNVTLAGPATAAQVQAMADELLAAVGTSKLKRDHVQAIEVVFSLPPEAPVEPLAYFSRCLAWLRLAVPLPVLLATVHRDEAAPHMHALLLPVKDGKHVGGALNTRPNLKQLRESFFTRVAGPAGLKRDGAKVRGMVKQWAVAAVLARCEAMGLPVAMGPLWANYRASIEREPTPQMLVLGVDVNTLRPENDRIQSPIGLQPNPLGLAPRAMGLQKQGEKHQALSCVGLHQQTTPASATKAASAMPDKPAATRPKAISTLADQWAAVGCRSVWTKPTDAERERLHQLAKVSAVTACQTTAKRMQAARDAEALAKARQANRTKPAAMALAGAVHVDHDGLTRERDEHAHDLAAWAD